MEVKLVVSKGKRSGVQIPVPGPQFRIGRAPQCQLRPNSTEIAELHCAIVIEAGRALIRDLGSQTGTFLNGERIMTEEELRNGDRLRVGQLEFDVELTVSVGGKKSAVHSIREAAARVVEKAGGKDLDVSQWVAQGNEEEDQAALETQRILAQRTRKKSDDDKPIPKAEKTPGLFGQEAPKQTSVDSRSAAADLLNKLLGPPRR